MHCTQTAPRSRHEIVPPSPTASLISNSPLTRRETWRTLSQRHGNGPSPCFRSRPFTMPPLLQSHNTATADRSGITRCKLTPNGLFCVRTHSQVGYLAPKLRPARQRIETHWPGTCQITQLTYALCTSYLCRKQYADDIYLLRSTQSVLASTRLTSDAPQ